MRDVYTKVYYIRNTVFSDQTVQFPARSKRGNKYIVVMVEIDSNATLMEPIKNRTDAELTRAYCTMILRLKHDIIIPQKHILDNDVSNAMETIIRYEYKMKLELVPPGCNCCNAAEVAIRNFKAHFLSVLAGTADRSPPTLWNRHLPQAEVTVNLLRKSNAAPNVSAYAHLSGSFDYNKMPLVPMGCEAQVHNNTDKRGTWAYHSVDGWYLATSPEHYCKHLCHIKKTNSERFTDTAHFSHQKTTKPTITYANKVMAAIAHCDKTIKNIGSNDGAYEMQQLLKLTKESVINNVSISKSAKPDPHNNAEQRDGSTHALPRVHTIQPLGNEYRRVTRNMAKDTPLLPRVPPTAFPRVEKMSRMAQEDLPLNNQMITRNNVRRRRQIQTIPTISDSAPARNTRSQTRTTTTASSRTRPSTRSNKRLSQLMQTTPAKRNKTMRTEHTAAIEERLNIKHLGQMTQKSTA